jgi:hypothetical protein
LVFITRDIWRGDPVIDWDTSSFRVGIILFDDLRIIDLKAGTRLPDPFTA